jgi:NhaP-type Na+/H+ or K+/H+ antiporter
LVLVTAGAVAVVARHGLSWPVAWVLDAVLAPTDVTAVAAVARRMPRRQITILRAESLINDGTTLVLFAIAVEVASGEPHFGWPQAIGAFVLSYLGGAAIGLVTAWLRPAPASSCEIRCWRTRSTCSRRSPHSCSPRRSTRPARSPSWCAGSP